MKRQPKLLLTLLFTAIFITSLLGCGDTPEAIVLDEILQKIPSYESPYTGGLQRIGTAKGFGLDLDDPVAIEWNDESTSMNSKRCFYNEN